MQLYLLINIYFLKFLKKITKNEIFALFIKI